MKGAIGKMMMGGEEAAEQPAGKLAGKPSAKPAGKPAKGQQASPEEQSDYERAVLAGVDVIFDPQTSPGVLKMMQSSPDAQGIAQATALVIQILEEQAKGQLPPDIILDLADELGGNVMALGAKNGLFTVDESLKGKAAQQIDILLGEMYGFDQEDAEGLLADVSEEELATIQAEQSALAGGA